MLGSFRKSLTKFTAKPIDLAIALISGSLMGMTFAPVGAWYLAWVALAPLWYLLCRKDDSGKVIYPLCWGIGCYGLGLVWIVGIHPMTWMGVPFFRSLIFVTFCLIFITLWGSSLAVFWSAGMGLINTKQQLNPFVRVILGTAGWCVLENVYSLTNLWWTSLALSQSPHNLNIIHLGQLSGPTMVSGGIVLVNGLIAEGYLAFDRYQHQPMQKVRSAVPYLTTAIVMVIGLHSIGYVLASQELVETKSSALKVGIIQGNIGNDVMVYQSANRLAIENYTQGYLSLADRGVDVVITPETALPFTESQIKTTPFYREILTKGVPAFVGGFGELNSRLTNSMLNIDGTGTIVSRYDKAKLVPLGEYIPFEEIVGTLVEQFSPFNARLVPGKFGAVTMTPFGNIIFGICYDSAYAEHFRLQARTAGLIVTAANDTHYTAAMPAQHHAQNIMRAVETDRWAVQASNTGYSAIVDPHGQTRWISGLNEFTTHAGVVYRRGTQTLYVRFGDWLTPLLVVLGLGLFIRTSGSSKLDL